jgi:hypothetical protein
MAKEGSFFSLLSRFRKSDIPDDSQQAKNGIGRNIYVITSLLILIIKSRHHFNSQGLMHRR